MYSPCYDCPEVYSCDDTMKMRCLEMQVRIQKKVMNDIIESATYPNRAMARKEITLTEEVKKEKFEKDKEEFLKMADNLERKEAERRAREDERRNIKAKVLNCINAPCTKCRDICEVCKNKGVVKGLPICNSCKDRSKWEPVSEFCPDCGRPISENARRLVMSYFE